MDYGMFEEALVDFFCRQHHDPATARSRAQAIIHIAQGCDEEIVGGDRGLVLDCTPLQIRPLIEEGDIAIATVRKFNQRKKLVLDLTSPENMGGRWLQPLRDAAEKLRRAALKQAGKAKKPK